MQTLVNNFRSASSFIKNVTGETFHQDVIEKSKSHGVLVDFWASWCAPCRQLTPLLEKIIQDYKDRFVLAKINIDEQPEIAQQMRVQTLPTVIAFVNGVPVDGFAENLTSSELKAFMERVKHHLPLSIDDYLTEAQNKLLQHDISGSLEIFTQVLTQDPKNVKALIGMSRCYLAQKDLSKAKTYQGLIPLDSETSYQSEIKILEKALNVAEAGQNIKNLQSLRDDLKQNPENVDQRFTVAKGLFAQGHVADAIEELFIILQQKDFAITTKAKDELMNFFDILGLSHPLTMTARKRLSKVLFA